MFWLDDAKQQVTAKQATQKQHHDKVTTNISRYYYLHPRIPWSTQVDTWLLMVNLTMAELWNITYTSYVLEKSLLRLFLHQLRTTLSDSVDIYPYSPQTTTVQTTAHTDTTEAPKKQYPLWQCWPPDCLKLNFDGKAILDIGRCEIVDFGLYRDNNLKVCRLNIHE